MSSGGAAQGSLSRVSGVIAESGLAGAALRIIASFAGASVRTRILSAPSFYRFAASKVRAELARNERYRDRHRGQHAFVVATGPSVAGQSFEALRGSVVISVNENFHYLAERGIKPDYNVLQDDAYFRSAQTYRGFRKDLLGAALGNGLVPVLPVRAARLVDGPEWDIVRPAYFLEVGDALAVGPRVDLADFTRPLPGLATVTHVAVAWALFLGCSQVSVLGVDLDYSTALDQPIRHCYGENPYSDLDEISAAEAFQKYSRVRADGLREHVRRQGELFDLLGAVAATRGQTIVDASLHGRVGSLDKRPLPRL